MNETSSSLRQHLKDRKVKVCELSKACEMHSPRLSAILNLWVRPNADELRKMVDGFKLLRLDQRKVTELEKLYVESIPKKRRGEG